MFIDICGRNMTLGSLILQRKWVPGAYAGVKTAGTLHWPYYLHEPTVLRSGSLKIQEHQRPVDVCDAIVFLHGRFTIGTIN